MQHLTPSEVLHRLEVALPPLIPGQGPEDRDRSLIFNHPFLLGGGEHSLLLLSESLQSSAFSPWLLSPAGARSWSSSTHGCPCGGLPSTPLRRGTEGSPIAACSDSGRRS
jgi:hypothetical protein